MLQPPNRPKGRMPEIELVITSPPDGTVLHKELGLHSTGMDAHYYYGTEYGVESGSSIGMEWRTKDGRKLAFSDYWANRLGIVGSFAHANKNPKERHSDLPAPHNYVESISDAVDQELDMNEAEGNPDEWLEYMINMQRYLKYLQYGLLKLP